MREKPQQELKGSHLWYICEWPIAWDIQNQQPPLRQQVHHQPQPSGQSPWEECSGQKLAPPPGFMGIMMSLHGDNPPHKVMSIPQGLAKEQGPIWIAESTMFPAQLLQDSLSGATYTDMMTCSMSLVGLGVTPSADDCSMPTFMGEEDTDSD